MDNNIFSVFSEIMKTTLIGKKGRFDVEIKIHNICNRDVYDIDVTENGTPREDLGAYIYQGTSQENQRNAVEYINKLETL